MAVLSPTIFIVAGLIMAVAIVVIVACCVAAAEADRELDARFGGLRIEEEMLLTYEEICRLPEVRR